MSWQTVMVKIVRYMINDIDGTTYTDNRLEETILVSASLLYPTMDFNNVYDIDIDNSTMTPDPTEIGDDWFVNLVCIKTACIILGSEAKTLAAQSYRITDGPATIDVGGAYKATLDLYKDTCAKFDKAVMDYRAGNSIAGQSVLTPYTQTSISEGNPINNYDYYT